MNPQFYLLKIALCETEPAIWRRFVVPADISLDRLHDVIQIVMGWQDTHLYEFVFGRKRFTEAPEEPEQGKEAAFFRLCDLIHMKGKQFSYQYDFGDSWWHDITLEQTNASAGHLPCVFYCTEGERHCPPEDCGGTDGYRRLLSVLSEPEHEEYSETRDWLDGMSALSCSPVFSAETIDLNVINYRLECYWRWSRLRYLPFTE
ncbi:MAG: plasmid pRiA4b ORF-3 family protein [Yokenella regensburgei]|jgi:hypothetical protein|nr:plasmid pRiA4b ORF-3 family protein [Yokenella regensburgei]